MQFIKSKKALVLLGVTIAAVVAAVAGYAYFTTTGSGSGDLTAGSNSATIALHATLDDGIVPGDAGTAVTFTGDNPNTTTSLRVGTISFNGVSSSDDACQAVIDAAPSQFSMADVASDTTIPAKANGYALAGTGTLLWANQDSLDQTPCAGAPLTLHVTSN